MGRPTRRGGSSLSQSFAELTTDAVTGAGGTFPALFLGVSLSAQGLSARPAVCPGVWAPPPSAAPSRPSAAPFAFDTCTAMSLEDALLAWFPFDFSEL